jgi:hypothetical protein
VKLRQEEPSSIFVGDNITKAPSKDKSNDKDEVANGKGADANFSGSIPIGSSEARSAFWALCAVSDLFTSLTSFSILLVLFV